MCHVCVSARFLFCWCDVFRWPLSFCGHFSFSRCVSVRRDEKNYFSPRMINEENGFMIDHDIGDDNSTHAINNNKTKQTRMGANETENKSDYFHVIPTCHTYHREHTQNGDFFSSSYFGPVVVVFIYGP